MIMISKKYLLSFISILAISIIIADICKDNMLSTNGMPLSGKTVLIDAGHGGIDPGQPGITGKHEAEINMMITNKLKSYLHFDTIKGYHMLFQQISLNLDLE